MEKKGTYNFNKPRRALCIRDLNQISNVTLLYGMEAWTLKAATVKARAFF